MRKFAAIFVATWFVYRSTDALLLVSVVFPYMGIVFIDLRIQNGRKQGR